jgi:hypothetical protein
MPKRVVDGEALWGSSKIASLTPQEKPEYANLLPLAFANGSFECDARRIWTRVYAFNRPEWTIEMVATLLDSLEKAKLLFRWTAADGKTWGYWAGIDKPGRLPGLARRGTNEVVGEEPPRDLLAKFLNSPMDANGIHTDANGIQPREAGELHPADHTNAIPTTTDANGIQKHPHGCHAHPCLGSGLGSCIGLGGSKTDPLASAAEQEEVPAGLHQLNYATRLLEDLGLPASGSVTQLVASAISSFAKKEKVEKCEAYTRMLKRAKEDQEQGIEINRFWFDDGRYLPKSPVKAPASATPTNSQCDNGAADEFKAKARAWIAENPEEAVKRDEDYRADGTPGYLERFMPREEAEKLRNRQRRAAAELTQ